MNLKWFKKLFATNEDEYREAQVLEDDEELVTPTHSRTPFRFPLITDDEKKDSLFGELKIEKEMGQPIKDKHIRDDQPYRPLYTHELWQQRKQEPIVHRAPKKEIIEPPVKEKRKKAFTPTQVPSPVFGFSRNQENKIEEPIEQTIREIELPFEELAITAIPTQAEENEVLPLVSFTEEEKVLPSKHIDEQVQDTPLETVSEVKPSKQKENIRPFNVLMLKSDKEKMNNLVKEMPVYQPKKEPNKVEKIVLETDSKPASSPSNYARPDLSYLLPPELKNEDREWMEEQAFTLIEALSHFQVTGEIVQMDQGPAVTQFEITVAHGTKVSKIRNLSDDLKLALAAKDIRIQAPIPGKSSIGIEIPNRKSRAVRLSEVINTNVFFESESPLEVALGLDLTGKPVTLDLRKMPHGLIAGATGSGKSVFINSLLVSLLYKATPEEVKLLLIDPKMVELAPFNHIPHLVSPVITDVKAATAALKWAVEEMERRYQLFAHIGVRDINRYNSLATEKRQFAQKLPFIVIVIDELADLMMMAPTEVEDAICRIAQKARACGIHLVLATQRPSVDVITGLIKANIPTRIAFSVSSQIDSRTILDQQGAERLLGKGDMLYQGNGMSSPVRIQGTFVTDEEIETIIDYARTQGTPEYMFEQEELLQKAENVSEQDELFEEACRFIVEQGSASTSLLQRKFHLGYNRAARLIDAMYENGYVTEQKGSKAREVLLTDDSLEQIFS
ncbi:DNA translocase FtsK [Psychrobacillus glaciei]|uniref:DNA translocase FtsK n=1 Tax=Psychrobacillus glaciei TaxID=2283160 RepID=A0A5J6SQD5_9BACI|nr:DNA translocase FtsK [Psychrobacillus glaciei]QFF99733.1 DNA translocase FtsK [Psychrobacillus glaciei]